MTTDPSQTVWFGWGSVNSNGVGSVFDGTGKSADSVLPSAIFLSLIGKIGGTTDIGTGTPIPDNGLGKGPGFVGSSYSEGIPWSGRLFLGFNDVVGYFFDNSGSWSVTINLGQPDIAPTSLAWNTDQGGVDFSYQVTDTDLPQDTTAALYWASGPTENDIIQPATLPIPISAPRGFSGTIHLDDTDLSVPPVGTTHLLFVTDPDNLIQESNEGNNAMPLELCQHLLFPAIRPHATGSGIQAEFTPPGGLQVAARACGFDHFNWVNWVFFDNDPNRPTVNGVQPDAPPGYLDPPLGGWDYQQKTGGDDFNPGYWNEDNGELGSYTTSSTLTFEDLPGVSPGASVRFRTGLIGVDSNGNNPVLLGDVFEWEATSIGVSVRKNVDPSLIQVPAVSLLRIIPVGLLSSADIALLAAEHIAIGESGPGAPVLNTIPDKVIDEGSSVSLFATATDPNPSDVLTFSLVAGAPAGASIDSQTGEFSWTPPDGPGLFPVTVRVTPNGSEKRADETIFLITVNNVPPTAAITGPTDGVRGQPRTFTLSASDPSPVDQAAGFTFNIDWGDGSTTTGSATSQGSFTAGHTYVIILPRSFTVRVTVTDAAGASGSGTKVVSVLLL